MENIINKIRALIEKAQSNKEIGELAEAESLIAMAEKLMEKYNIDMHAVRMAAAMSNDKFANWVYGERVYTTEHLAGNRWRHDLIKMLCEHNLTAVIFGAKGEKPSFRVYGDISNVEVTVFLYHFLDMTLLRLAKEYRASLDSITRDMLGCRHTVLKSFLDGAITGISRKLHDQKEESEHKAAMGALIKYNDKALDEYLKEKIKDFVSKMPKQVDVKVDSAFEAGRIAGENVKLTGRRLEDAVKSKLLK